MLTSDPFVERLLEPVIKALRHDRDVWVAIGMKNDMVKGMSDMAKYRMERVFSCHLQSSVTDLYIDGLRAFVKGCFVKAHELFVTCRRFNYIALYYNNICPPVVDYSTDIDTLLSKIDKMI